MAYLLGLPGRQLIRGISVAGATLPRQVRPAPSEPSRRLAIYSAAGEQVAAAPLTRAGLKKLVDAGLPVTIQNIADSQGVLGDTERAHLARWIDTLDKF